MAFVLALALLIGGCTPAVVTPAIVSPVILSSPTPSPTPQPTVTPEPTPTETAEPTSTPSPVVVATVVRAGPTVAIADGVTCDQCIKGNISDSGERIYHVPGCQGYDATVIHPEDGERYFSTETDARAAGWRKALNCP